MAAPSHSPSAEAEYWRIKAMAQQVSPRVSGTTSPTFKVPAEGRDLKKSGLHDQAVVQSDQMYYTAALMSNNIVTFRVTVTI